MWRISLSSYWLRQNQLGCVLVCDWLPEGGLEEEGVEAGLVEQEKAVELLLHQGRLQGGNVLRP